MPSEYMESVVVCGTFDNLTVFIQEITEAARASKNSLVVASIPESDIEIGGELVGLPLKRSSILLAVWNLSEPVAANEGFEVVRRRLFFNRKDPDSRDLCSRFTQMYIENAADFQ